MLQLYRKLQDEVVLGRLCYLYRKCKGKSYAPIGGVTVYCAFFLSWLTIAPAPSHSFFFRVRLPQTLNQLTFTVNNLPSFSSGVFLDNLRG